MQNAMKKGIKFTEKEMMVLGFRDVDVTESTIDRQSNLFGRIGVWGLASPAAGSRSESKISLHDFRGLSRRPCRARRRSWLHLHDSISNWR